MRDSLATSVAGGLAIGISLIILFAIFVPLLPPNLRSVQPAALSAQDPSANVEFENRIKLDNSLWQTWISQGVISNHNQLFISGIENPPPAGASPPYDEMEYKSFLISADVNGVVPSNIQYSYLPNSRYSSGAHIVTANDDVVYVMWSEYVANEKAETYIQRSMDGGKSYANINKVTNSSLAIAYNNLAVSNKDANVVYVVRIDDHQINEPRHSEIFFSSSHDGGQRFEYSAAIMGGEGTFTCPQIATGQSADGKDIENIYIAWREDFANKEMKLWFTASDDRGATFNKPIAVASGYAEDYDCPKFTVFGQKIYLLWSQTELIRDPFSPSKIIVGDTDIFFRASMDGGKSFNLPINLSSRIGAFTMEHDMAVSEDGNDIYVVWRDTIPRITTEGIKTMVDYYGNSEIIFTKSEDGGKTFTEPVNLSNNPSGSYEPEIAVSGNNVFIIWLESDFPSNVANTSFRMSSDGGDSFGSTIDNITGIMGETFSRPDILVSTDGSKFFTIWSHRPDPEDANTDAYLLVGNR